MYEELIERLYAHCNTNRSDAITNEAADALVALQAENGSKDKEIERLRAKAKQWRQTAEENFASCEKLQAALSRMEAERDTANERGEYFREKADEEIKIRLKYGKELERVTAERDVAISDVPHDCEHCNHAVEYGACKLLPDGDQFSPDYTDGFDRDRNCDHWEWRGAQGEG